MFAKDIPKDWVRFQDFFITKDPSTWKLEPRCQRFQLDGQGKISLSPQQVVPSHFRDPAKKLSFEHREMTECRSWLIDTISLSTTEAPEKIEILQHKNTLYIVCPKLIGDKVSRNCYTIALPEGTKLEDLKYTHHERRGALALEL